MTILNAIVSLLFFIVPWFAIIALQQNGLYIGMAGCVIGIVLFSVAETILLAIVGGVLELALHKTHKAVNGMLHKTENVALANNSYKQKFQLRFKFDTFAANYAMRFRATPTLEIYSKV